MFISLLAFSLSSPVSITVSKVCSGGGNKVCLSLSTSIEEQLSNIFSRGSFEFEITIDSDADCTIKASVFDGNGISIVGNYVDQFQKPEVTLVIDSLTSSFYVDQLEIRNVHLIIKGETDAEFKLDCGRLIIDSLNSFAVVGDFLIKTKYLELAENEYMQLIKKITFEYFSSPAILFWKFDYETRFYLDRGSARINNTDITFLGDMTPGIEIKYVYGSSSTPNPNITITSVSLDAPTLYIGRSVNLNFESQVLSPITYAASDPMIFTTDIEHISFDLNIKGDLTIILKGSVTRFEGTVAAYKLILLTEGTEGTVDAYFPPIDSSLDIKSSMLVIHTSSLSVSAVAGAPQINFTIGANRVSQIIVDGTFTIYGTSFKVTCSLSLISTKAMTNLLI